MIKGIGTDIVEVGRISEAIERWGDHFLNHVYTPAEIDYCRKHKLAIQHFAGRFAAKEAVVKALGETAGLDWKDIVISNEDTGKPTCTIAKKKLKAEVHVSISHTKTYAIAFAVITT